MYYSQNHVLAAGSGLIVQRSHRDQVPAVDCMDTTPSHCTYTVSVSDKVERVLAESSVSANQREITCRSMYCTVALELRFLYL